MLLLKLKEIFKNKYTIFYQPRNPELKRLINSEETIETLKHSHQKSTTNSPLPKGVINLDRLQFISAEERAGNNNFHNVKLGILHLFKTIMENIIDTPEEPGTKLEKNKKPKNKLDGAAREHDYFYKYNKDTKTRRVADKVLEQKAMERFYDPHSSLDKIHRAYKSNEDVTIRLKSNQIDIGEYKFSFDIQQITILKNAKKNYTGVILELQHKPKQIKKDSGDGIEEIITEAYYLIKIKKKKFFFVWLLIPGFLTRCTSVEFISYFISLNKLVKPLCAIVIPVVSSAGFDLNERFGPWTKPVLDKIYGPVKLSDGVFRLGDKELQFFDNVIHVEGDTRTYPVTRGIVDLLFLKSPESEKYTKADLNTYKSILIQTSVHKTSDGLRIRKSKGRKSGLISNLFSRKSNIIKGAGISMRLQKYNITYWNDPNELLERLRLLYSSLAAGNTGVRNEIISICEELVEAKILKKIPNKGEEVAAAASKIFAQNSPNLLHVDRGREFYNKHFEALVKKHNIKMYSTFSAVKASIVERFNRTLKQRMFKEFTSRGSRDWITILPALIDDYNNSMHRTIGMAPAQADAHPSRVTLKHDVVKTRKIKFHVGDKVRISVYKGVFTRGYLPNWSTEIFTIIKVNKTTPSTFILQDYTGSPIAGGFYAEEIRKTMLPDDYLVEKVIRTKGRRVFVRWLGFTDEHNCWINKIESLIKSVDIASKNIQDLKINLTYANTRIVMLEDRVDGYQYSLRSTANGVSYSGYSVCAGSKFEILDKRNVGSRRRRLG
ncbi:hypothetical protein QTP88_001446 [Uroleucon formosanum]